MHQIGVTESTTTTTITTTTTVAAATGATTTRKIVFNEYLHRNSKGVYRLFLFIYTKKGKRTGIAQSV
jgi:hypothetical protein